MHMPSDRSELPTIAPDRLDLYTDELGRLCARIEGRSTWQGVSLRLAFPYSGPDGHVFLYHDDDEIGMVRRVDELDAQVRDRLQDALDEQYMIPKIRQILDIEEVHNATRWWVVTDRGERHFEVQDRHNFRRIRGGGIVVIDVDANRYRIPDPNALDPRSRRKMDFYY